MYRLRERESGAAIFLSDIYGVGAERNLKKDFNFVWIWWDPLRSYYYVWRERECVFCNIDEREDCQVRAVMYCSAGLVPETWQMVF